MKKTTIITLFMAFMSMNVMSQSYMTWLLEEQNWGDQEAIVNMFDKWHKDYNVTYKSGAFELIQLEANISDKTTHRFNQYGDINNWGSVEESPEQGLAFFNTLFKANNLIADWTHHESGRALYSDGNSFDNYPYRMFYRMTIEDLDTYKDAFKEFMESKEIVDIRGDRPPMMGQTVSGVNDGKAYWSYLGFLDREDFLRVTETTQNTEAFKKFISTVSDIRTVEETRGETLVKSWK